MYAVKDGDRTLEFDGVLLGSSSSRRKDSTRWIEFNIYRTENGTYILSRIGASIVYHSGACNLVDKYRLTEINTEKVVDGAEACAVCKPTLEAPMVFPEKYRYWAQVSDEPQAVLDALYKYDEGGARYLTAVAKRVLQEASKTDSNIDLIYRFEKIP